MAVGRIIKKILFFSILTVLFAGGAGLVWAAKLTIPDFNSFEERRVIQSTKIYDRTGKITLFDVYEDIRRTVVPFEKIATSTKSATIAIEDSAFYEHAGVRPTSILRALWTNLTTGSRIGGSTITQQVIKNTVLTNEKQLSRKLKEAILAVRLERVMDKDQILSLYLNEIPYGGSIYGVEEAALAFFGKHAEALTLSESAYLAALPQAPTYYSPYGQHRDALEERKNIVLARMHELGHISQEELLDAQSTRVEFLPQSNQRIKAPHFVIYVREYLVETYGEDVVNNNGLRVITTLDYDLQQNAEEIVRRYALENETKFNAENASLMAIDPQNGEILTMVGSRDYFDPEIEGNFNIGLAKRQPGSTFKPFVYATAFKEGYTPDTILFDVETQFSTACDAFGTPLGNAKPSDCYTPVNYDDIYRGPMTMREALAQSINIPAIKTLYLTGLNDSLQTAKDLGITTLADPGRYGLTLVLGGGETSLLEMTSAYGVFANGGVRNPYFSILRVEDKNGNILEESRPHSERALKASVAATINDILSDNIARTPSYGPQSPLYFPGYTVAAKTGTTNDYHDAWILGYTPTIAVGAWAGNNDNTPMVKKVAGLIISPMWNEFMSYALTKRPVQSFEAAPVPPENLKPVLRGQWRGSDSYTIDSVTGKLATANTPEELRREVFLTRPHSILHWVTRGNPQGPAPTNPAADSQYILWELPIQQWAASQGIVEGVDTKPTESDDVHDPLFAPRFSIISPHEGSTLAGESIVSIQIALEPSKYPTAEASYYLDTTYLGKNTGTQPSFLFRPDDYGITKGVHLLRVDVYDEVRNKTTHDVEITIN